MKLKPFEICYFLCKNSDGTPDGNAMSTEDRIADAFALFENEVAVLLADNKTQVSCKNADELRLLIKDNNTVKKQ